MIVIIHLTYQLLPKSELLWAEASTEELFMLYTSMQVARCY